MGAVIVGVGQLHGKGTVGGGFDVGEESVALFRICGDVGHQLHLALPLAAADTVGYGERQLAALERGVRVEAAAPVSRAEPGLFEIEAAKEVVSIGITTGLLTGIIGSGQDGAVIDGVVLEDDAGEGNGRAVRVAAKVEDHLDTVRSVDAREVGAVEDQLLAGLDVLALGEEEVAVVTHIGELEGHVRDVLGRVHDDGEVIVLVGGKDNRGRRDDVELGLPLVGGCTREDERILAAIEARLRIGDLGPAGSIVEAELMGAVGREPDVGIGVVLEAVEHHGTRLGGDDVVPCDAALVVDEFEALAGGVEHLEFRSAPESVVVDVREQGVLRKDKVEVVAAGLELIGRALLADGGVVVLGVVALLADERFDGNALVDIGRAVFARIVGVCPVAAEGHDVFVDTEGSLLADTGMPPLQTVGSGRAAAHIVLDRAVDMPVLGVLSGGTAGEEGDVLVVVGKRVVDMEGLLGVVGRHAGRVHDMHADGIVAGLGEDFLETVAGVVFAPGLIRSLENPDRDDTLGIHGESDLVDLLVHGDDGLVRGSLGNLTLGRMVDLFLGAGENQRGGRENVC